MFAVRINGKIRYVSYCDECWYETTENPIYIFTEQEARKIAQQMKSHYVYDISVIAEDGTTVFSTKKNPMTVETEKITTAKSFKKKF